MTSSRKIIETVGRSYQTTLRTMLGGDRCRREIFWPSNGKWYLIQCPLPENHKGLHAEENYVPLCTDEDADWLYRQYVVSTDQGEAAE